MKSDLKDLSSNQPGGAPPPATHQPAAPKEEEIDEFFGHARKSSQKQFYVDSEDEGSGDLGVQSDEESDDSGGVASHMTRSEGGVDLQRIMESRR